MSQAPATGRQTGTLPASTLTIGTRVRVRSTILRAKLYGPVLTLDEKVLALDGAGGPLNIPLDSIEALERSLGRKRQWLEGLVAAGLTGFGLGFAQPVDPQDCDGGRNFCSRGEAVGASTIIAAALGAGIGALFKTERWAPVDAAILTQVAIKKPDATTLTVSPVLMGDRKGLAMSLRF